MTQHVPPQSLSLFDLIARSWPLGTGIAGLRFNAVGSSVAVSLADGNLAFLPVADAEDPDQRMRTELETGRMTIRPRQKPLPAPARTEAPLAHHGIAPCRVAQQGFAFVHRDGDEIWRATAKGQTLRVARAEGAPVTALAALPGNRGLLVARAGRLSVVTPEDGLTVAATELPHATPRIALSADATRLACWGPGRMTILDVADLGVIATLPVEGTPVCLDWSPDGRWLAGGCAEKALLLVDVANAAADRIVDFPAAVTSLGFSDAAGVLVASGAFRVTGWRLPDLPFGTHEGLPVETGKPGLTLVETVAPHPTRDLCAVGYANGLVTLCQIGRREEMMLREGRGAAVTSLAWSPDGAHLALGTGDGTAAIATFPKNLLK